MIMAKRIVLLLGALVATTTTTTTVYAFFATFRVKHWVDSSRRWNAVFENTGVGPATSRIEGELKIFNHSTGHQIEKKKIRLAGVHLQRRQQCMTTIPDPFPEYEDRVIVEYTLRFTDLGESLTDRFVLSPVDDRPCSEN